MNVNAYWGLHVFSTISDLAISLYLPPVVGDFSDTLTTGWREGDDDDDGVDGFSF